MPPAAGRMSGRARPDTYASRCTIAGEYAGKHTATYSAPSGTGVRPPGGTACRAELRRSTKALRRNWAALRSPIASSRARLLKLAHELLNVGVPGADRAKVDDLSLVLFGDIGHRHGLFGDIQTTVECARVTRRLTSELVVVVQVALHDAARRLVGTRGGTAGQLTFPEVIMSRLLES